MITQARLISVHPDLADRALDGVVIGVNQPFGMA